MKNSKEILDLIAKANTQNKTLSNQETLTILESISNISENKTLITNLVASWKLLNSEKVMPLLTHRESQIFYLIGCDYTSKEVAIQLNISLETISTHRKNIIKKMKLKGSNKLKFMARQYLQQQHNDTSKS